MWEAFKKGFGMVLGFTTGFMTVEALTILAKKISKESQENTEEQSETSE